MVDLDFRTRSESDVRALDFAAFWDEELPALLRDSDRGRLAARGARQLGVGALAFHVQGRSVTLAVDGETLTVRPGDTDAKAIVSLEPSGFSDLMQDRVSTMGLTLASEIEMKRGGVDDFVEWEPVLRALMDGRPVYEPGSVTFRDRNGAPLDLEHTFRADDDADEMAHFLAEAGFLHVAGLFERELMQQICDDIDAALPLYAPDDRRSWWARTQSGEHRPVRLQYFQEHSPATHALLRDARFLWIGALASNGHVPARREGENAVEALVKPLGVKEGISDVPWHKDCSLGMHGYRCCSITTGICVTDADRGSGELGVVAGSHRASVPPVGVHEQVDLPRIPLSANAGDVTVHLSCTLHMSRPPTESERRVLYTGFGLPLRAGETGKGLDRLRRIREGAPKRMGAESRDELGRVGSFELDS